MATEDDGKIRITSDDLERVTISRAVPSAGAASPDYGRVSAAAEPEQTKASVFLKGWVYLGIAGFTGALLAWAICEPRFVDGGGRNTWANALLFPLMLALMCVGFGSAEGIVERTPRKAAMRGLASLGLGLVLGFLFFAIAGLIFTIGLSILAQIGPVDPRHPGFWLVRGIAWMGFGVAGGLVYGIVGQSGKKCLYGIAGGVLGAGLGGMLFDPIAMLAHGGAASRAVGMVLFGSATGIAMGLVESALKDRWIYVSGGPLAGKHFILYKPVTTIGSDQSCDIYLFKDPTILPRHAAIELNGLRATLRAAGPVLVKGRPLRDAVLLSGDSIQIGRYTFQYKDRQRA
ncbi:MAG: FHA domain-containing protein [Bryobacteraceae bacterium]